MCLLPTSVVVRYVKSELRPDYEVCIYLICENLAVIWHLLGMTLYSLVKVEDFLPSMLTVLP